jgi:gas vesicle protein
VSRLKTLLIWTLFGAIAGAVVASLLVPSALSWYNEAGYATRSNQVPSLVNVPDVVRYATRHLIHGQLIGAALGACVFLIIGALATRPHRLATPAVAEEPKP